jgi:single-strand DNA-binding protein
MNNLNSILIEGNLVRDPLFRSTTKGTPLCTFSLASNRYCKQDSGLEREVSFFDVETWAKLAENCYSLGRKGRGVRVVGRLKQDRWSGPDGKGRSKITIVAEHVEFRPEFKRNEDTRTGRTGAMAEEATSMDESSSIDAYTTPSAPAEMAAEQEAQFPGETLEDLARDEELEEITF